MEWNWQNSVEKAQESAADLDHAIQALTAFRDKAVSDIAAALRMDKGIELDLDAIHATLTRPYTIIPINEHEAWLIHWRGVKMPIFGWVVAQEPAFIKAKVSRAGTTKDRVQISPIIIHDAVNSMNKPGDLIDLGIKDAMRVRAGHHEPGAFRREHALQLLDVPCSSPP